eukprot:GFYU01004150.1.p1 GENE.GFYU01004150.1~~GFYU01004150.1.p1  ORF type:complete len:372 (+),score=63.81 GFYU01004150.1:56-1171(+)
MGEVLSALASSGSAPSQEYERQYARWSRLCDAITQEETRLRQERMPGRCKLYLYWWQQFLMFIELIVRFVLHFVMMILSALVFVFTWCFWKEAPDQLYHHWGMINMYCCFPSWLCNNIMTPSEPHYVYEEEVKIRRPPKPVNPNGGGKNGDCCDCDCSGCNNCDCCDDLCSCDDTLPFINRMIRSTMCVLSLNHSCHPNMTCGPCCNCYENADQRFKRWEDERQDRIDRFTNEFYTRYNEQHGETWVPPTRHNDPAQTPYNGYYRPRSGQFTPRGGSGDGHDGPDDGPDDGPGGGGGGSVSKTASEKMSRGSGSGSGSGNKKKPSTSPYHGGDGFDGIEHIAPSAPAADEMDLEHGPPRKPKGKQTPPIVS